MAENIPAFTTLNSLMTARVRRTFLNHSTQAEKRYNPNDSSLMFVNGEDRLDVLCEGFSSLRAQMSCGHAVTPMSLTNWCKKLLEDGESRFVCAVFGCNKEWPFEEVQKMALLTPEEVKYFEKTLALNTADTRKCPECLSHLRRENEFSLCVRCQMCSAKKGGVYEFCWQCLREWKGPQPRLDRCENDGCCNMVLKTLSSCPDMVFESVYGVSGCPCVRACPTCGCLLEHRGKLCKHITCPRCKVTFCFVCLKIDPKCYLTSEIYELCSGGVAPRQTVVPVWKRK